MDCARFQQHPEAAIMFSIRRFWRARSAYFVRGQFSHSLCAGRSFCSNGSVVCAAISSSGDISPVPPAAGGAVVGPLRIGEVDVATMTINTSGGASPLTNTNSVLIGETETGIGIVNMSGFGSDWTLTSSSADMTIGILRRRFGKPVEPRLSERLRRFISRRPAEFVRRNLDLRIRDDLRRRQ